MEEYISKRVVLDTIAAKTKYVEAEIGEAKIKYPIMEAFEVLNAIIRLHSSEDVIPVIRCRKCDNWDLGWQTEKGKHYCPKLEMQTELDFHCGYGEIRAGWDHIPEE